MFLTKNVLYVFLNLKVSPMGLLSFVAMVFGSLVSVFSGSWVGMWLGLEINLLGFIVLMNPEGVVVIEPCIKYFVVQSLGSGMVLVSFLANEAYLSNFLEVFLMLGLMLKSGLAPLHFWLPSVVNSSSWFVGGMILTWQKLAPFVLVGWTFSSSMLIASAVLLALIGGVGGLNQHSVRALMAYSSLVHSSWMLMALLSSFSLFLLYWIIYSVSAFLMFWSCSYYNKQFLKSKMRAFVGCCSLLMLSGLPPFLGFFTKVLVFLSVNSVALFVCVLGSVVSLKYYISFFFSLVFGSPYSDIFYYKNSFWLGFISLYLNVVGFVVLVLFFFT
uniref:NADH-ubiquinone oxidoreductase chain 2 n=1 Tax=Perumytilus purpuratus TaxID=390823 RepID=A0A346KL13_PERPP|nr:NADH dehydrogenase subunit 2 [Perumytilus purpuratus]